MDSDSILDEIKKIKEAADKNILKRYNFQLTERIILRFTSFSDCSECDTFMKEFAILIKEMSTKPLLPINKEYEALVKRATGHLEKKHKLVTDGYYMSIYMACGLGIGLPFGVLFSQLLGQPAYIGIGLPIGICIGVGIGSALDAKAKKDGLVI